MTDVHRGKTPKDFVRMGSHITLKHVITGRFLSSHKQNYYGGSKQQQVFGNRWTPGPDDYWIAIPAYKDDGEPGEKIRYGTEIRLKHITTRRNLHSHGGISSPKTNQQEVTCFGDDHVTDANDSWIVQRHSYNQIYDNSSYWHVDDIISLHHAATGLALHSHDHALDAEHQEVTCFGNGHEENDKWRIAFS
ncbi:13527_t:CDS:2 [Ambispora gerdemannii]|uniref:13527_t:CDS:1 n=1 Tax=Ambispora gerdemannii TaxID=144530 RepID=A0A9N8V8L7_9GLOM|nr:13527_t:CDS:2 [Ambispora gerdemannii]